MILYLDTSALVKLYIEEIHSDLIRKWVKRADTVALSSVAYAVFGAFDQRLLKAARKEGLHLLS